MTKNRKKYRKWKNCIICGKDTLNTSNHVKYCSEECYKKSRERQKKEEYSKRRGIAVERGKIYRKTIRLNALKIVGKGKLECSNCSCKDVRILEINHVNGGGNQETKWLASSRFFLDIVQGKRKTDDLNLLCKVCNIAHFVKLKYEIGYEIRPKSIVGEKDA